MTRRWLGAMLIFALLSASHVTALAAQPAKPRVGIDTAFGERFRAAEAAYRADRWDEVIRTTTAALAMKPDPRNASILLTWRAFAYMSVSRPAEALSDFNEAIRFDPRARGAHANRGLIRMDRGENDLAVSDLSEAIRQDPEDAELYGIRGSVYLRLGQRDRARADLERGITARATRSANYFRRGKAYYFLGRYREAGADFARAVRVAPKDSEMLNQLAWFQATCPDAAHRDGNAAVRNATRACELSQWKDAGNIDTLAAAYAEIGDFAQAVRYVTQAASMPNPFAKQRALIHDHSRAFQQGKPWRDESRV